MGCTAINYNPKMALAFTQFIVDAGLFNLVILKYFAQLHGKFLADIIFGIIKNIMSQSWAFDIDGLGRII